MAIIKLNTAKPTVIDDNGVTTKFDNVGEAIDFCKDNGIQYSIEY